MKTQDLTNRKHEKFVAGGKPIFTLPLGGKLLTLWVILKGTITIAGGSTSGAAVGEGIAELIQRVRVRLSKAAGSRYPDGVVVDMCPRSILRRAMLIRKKYLGDLGGSLAASGDAATYPIYLAMPIYFANPNLKKPIDTALNLDEYAHQNAQVELDLGSYANVNATCDRNVTLDLTVEVADQREAVDGDTYVVVQDDHTIRIGGVDARLEDKNLPQSGGIADLLIMAGTGANGNVATLADTILDEVRISGNNVDYYLKAKDIRALMYDQRAIDTDQTATGIYHVNFVSSKMLSKCVDASTLDLKLGVLNPSGANNDSMLVNVTRIFAPVNYTPIQNGQKARKG